MKNIEITSKNVNIYRQLLNIKEGKLVSNNKCVFIPVLLLILETLVYINLFIINPYINIGNETINSLIRLILFGGCFGISAKISTVISKKMALSYFKREHYDLNLDVDIKDLKRLLNEYSEIKRFNNNKYLEDSYIEIPSYTNQKTILQEQKSILQNESDFLKRSRSTGSNNDSKGYQKRIK